MGAGVIEWGEAEFVEYEEVGAQQGVDDFADGVVGQPVVVHLDEVGGGEVADFESGVHGGVPAADEQVTFACPGSEGDRLQQLRAVLPCEVRVVAETHPLFGRLLAAKSFKRWNGVLLLVIDLRDGSPGTIRCDATDVLGVVEPGLRSVLDGAGLRAFVDAINVDLSGVYYTVEAALPALLEHGEGGAIVITSSGAGLKSICSRFSIRSHGFAGYHAAKHGVVGLMRYYATSLAEKNIRVNTVHPTGVATPIILNPQVAEYYANHPEGVSAVQNLLPVPFVESADITEAMIYLCGHGGRYITGITMPVDAGLTAK